MKLIALAAASVMALAPMLVVTTSAEARPHMKRHHSRMMHRTHRMHRMPMRQGMTPMQRHMRNAPASPIGGPVGSGRP